MSQRVKGGAIVWGALTEVCTEKDLSAKTAKFDGTLLSGILYGYEAGAPIAWTRKWTEKLEMQYLKRRIKGMK